jgi:hypothetical protein
VRSGSVCEGPVKSSWVEGVYCESLSCTWFWVSRGLVVAMYYM